MPRVGQPEFVEGKAGALAEGRARGERVLRTDQIAQRGVREDEHEDRERDPGKGCGRRRPRYGGPAGSGGCGVRGEEQGNHEVAAEQVAERHRRQHRAGGHDAEHRERRGDDERRGGETALALPRRLLRPRDEEQADDEHEHARCRDAMRDSHRAHTGRRRVVAGGGGDPAVACRPVGARESGLGVAHERARDDDDERQRGGRERHARECNAQARRGVRGGDAHRRRRAGHARALARGRLTTAMTTAATKSIPPTIAISPPSPISPMPATCSSERSTAAPSATLRWTP